MELHAPNRVRHSATLHVDTTPDTLFPLLCPVRELEWTRGWDPLLVLSNSGIAEQDGVFVTTSERGETVWVISRHEPEIHELEMIMVTPGSTVGKLEIKLSDAGQGRSAADIAYTHTSLGPEGDKYLPQLTAEWYDGFMAEWDAELSHFLKTGSKLPE
jgi:hypothetical protein